VAFDITIIGDTSQDLEKPLRAAGMRVTIASPINLMQTFQAGAKTPAVVVLDVRGASGLPQVLPLLKREHPATGVVIVAAKLDPALMLEAMRAGVNEWVTAPVDDRELLTAVQRVAGSSVEQAKGEVFAIIGGKGGVGATTVAVNVATALAKLGSTLLIDLHASCGDAALFLGCDPNFTIIDALENTHRLDQVFLKGIVAKSKAGPDLLASPERAAAIVIEEKRIREVVECALRTYRYVVLDVPRSAGGIEQTLGLAAVITVVATQELAAIRGAARTAAVLRQRHGAQRVRIVVNRYEKGAEIASADLEHAVGDRVGFKFPSNYRLAIDALNKGRPVVVDNHNKLASAFASYARSLAQVESREPAEDRSSGLFGRFSVRR
jgi:pilus assembly protein CpaE